METPHPLQPHSSPCTFSFFNHNNTPNQLPLHHSFSASFTSICTTLDWNEVKLQIQLACPLIFVSFIQFSLQVISVMFVGHLGELALSGSSLAASFANVTGLSVLTGMASALETLCGQSYGARQYHLLGLHTQRAVVILTITSIPLSLIWARMGKILLFLGQDPDICRVAGEYARWLIPNLYAYASMQPLIKFLQAQSLVIPMVVCSSIALGFHIPMCWLMVYKTGLGYRGAALATSMSNWINMGMLLLYVRYSKRCEKTRTRLSWDALHEWNLFFTLAIPSALMMCLEWWSYEILILLSGLLPNPQLSTSALSICLNTASLAFMFPYGLSAASSTRVSNELGAGRPQAARHAVHISVGLAFLESLVVAAILFSIQNLWGWAYSNEEAVVTLVAALMPLLAASCIADSIQAVLSGVARGCGWQKLGAYANLGAFYIVGLPAAFLFGFVLHKEARGLWMGVMCGTFTQLIALLCITLATDWEKQAKKALFRVRSSRSLILPTEAAYLPLDGS